LESLNININAERLKGKQRERKPERGIQIQKGKEANIDKEGLKHNNRYTVSLRLKDKLTLKKAKRKA